MTELGRASDHHTVTTRASRGRSGAV